MSETADGRERECFIALYRDRTRYIRLAQRYVGSREMAEDLFHDSLIDFIRASRRQPIDHAAGYFVTILKHKCLHQLKTRQRELPVADFNSALLAEDIRSLEEYLAERTGSQVDFERLLERCRERLPELSMAVFEAKRIEGLSYKEIAANFGISQRRVNTEIQRALKVFREEFKEYRIFAIALWVLMNRLGG